MIYFWNPEGRAMKTVFLLLLLLSTGGCAAKQWTTYFGCVATLAVLAEQLFDIAQRERVPKVPAHGAKNQLGLRLLPLEDLRSDCLLHDLFRLPAPSAKVATQPDEQEVSEKHPVGLT